MGADTTADLNRTLHVEVPVVDVSIPSELANHPRYRVQNHLGAGGMGNVYRAEHVMMGRVVAVKVMAQKYTANPTAVERFRREVRAAAKLAHPNIVTAFDADEAEGRHFLVMEYVEGVSLDRVVNRRGPLPVAAACHIVRLVALGLQHAHSKGMVHRDIKPQNVMVNRKGLVKILDFGLARLATDVELPPDPTPSATVPQNLAMTGTNMVMGTPDYLSPEQAKSSRDVDHRSDIYSLGCLFYFALAGRPPFASAATAFDKVIAHTTEQPEPLSRFRTDVPDEVASILLRMMAKDPADRFANAQEVAAALLPFTKNSTASMNASGLVAIPLVEAIPLADFEVLEDTPAAISETLIETPPPTRRLKKVRRKPQRNWKRIAGIAAIAAGLLIVLAIAGSRRDDPSKDNAPVTGKVTPVAAKGGSASAARVLFALPKAGLFFDDYEPVRARLIELGATVTTMARTRGPCLLTQGSAGTPPDADLAFAEVRPEDYDAILFPGQQVFDFLQFGENRRQIERITRSLHASQKVIGGICVGQLVLIRLDLLNGRTAALPDDLVRPRFDNFGNVTWDSRRRVVTDGNLVTASGSRDARAFAEAVLAAIPKR